MKADFSRQTFDARKHYSAVLQQQGRVQVDADWNEQQQINGHRAACLITDLIGASGVPDTRPGFGLNFSADGSDLLLSPGRCYVDGLLCELDPGELLAFSSPGDDTVTLPLSRPELYDLAAGQWLLLAADGGTPQLQRIRAVAATDNGLTVRLASAVTRPLAPALQAGDFGGVAQRVASYLSQPDYPLPALAGNGLPLALALAAGVYLAYLDVWQAHVSALDDPAIRETALGGPDTAARAKTVWQLRLLPVTVPDGQGPTCNADYPEWDALLAGTSGRLSARSAPPAGPTGPCLIPPGGGYQGLENQLYRIEIHDPGNDGVATFKWSRDNASVVSRILVFDGSTLELDSTGPDDALGLANGEWVEVLGDVEELQGLPGQLLQITSVNPANATVSFAAPPSPIDAALHPKLRRWDSAGALLLPAGGSGWVDLELGVQVALSAGRYDCGDYWLVPARSGEAATVEWPYALPQPPQGVAHHYARIGIVQSTGPLQGSTVSDCRPRFAPLTAVPPALHVTAINWLNDDVMALGQFAAGLSLTLDGAPVASYDVDPGNGGGPQTLNVMTVNDDTMIVTVDMPVTVPNATTGVATALPVAVVLPSKSTTWDGANRTLTWLPSDRAQTIVNSGSDGQSRVRVQLKGDFIWGDQGQQRLYLDGQTRGKPGLSTSRTQSLRTDLALPSGSGRRSSNFDSWFLVQLATTPVSLQAFTVAPALLVGAGTGSAVVQLATLAREAVDVTLAVTSSPALPVDVNGGAPLVVAAGQSAANAVVTVSGPTTSSIVTVTATVPPIPQSNLVTTLSASFTVVVVSVAVTPPTTLLLSGASLRFSASIGAVGMQLPPGVDGNVVWSCSGGSIDGAGNYTAPGNAGLFTVTATSVADPSRSAEALVTVRSKTKDKDKDKEVINDKAIVVDKLVRNEKLRDVFIPVRPQVGPVIGPVFRPGAGPLLAPALGPAAGALPAAQPAVGGAAGGPALRAFIAPDQRPTLSAPLASPAAAAVSSEATTGASPDAPADGAPAAEPSPPSAPPLSQPAKQPPPPPAPSKLSKRRK